MNDDNATKYYGKYRGTVINNIDPLQTGRLLVQVSDVTGLTITSWALPCVPIAGKLAGIYAVPQIGSNVWVEFEHGDPDYPIWVGGWWNILAELPTPALPPLSVPASPSIVLQTTLQNSLFISDLPGPTGGIVLKSTTGAYIAVNDTGIYINNMKGSMITIVGPLVDINNGALLVKSL